MPSEVFNVERNDECICGSGKKYKKCCLAKVEQIHTSFLKAIEEEVMVTTEGREFLRIISVMYGIKLDVEGETDIERLSRIILQAWYEEDDIIDSKEEFMKAIEKILRDKTGMKRVRIPGFLLVEIDAATDDELEDVVTDALYS